MRTSAALPLHIKLAGPATAGEFSGVGATWVVDRHGERFMRGAFAESIAAWRERGALPPLLWQHDQHEPIGALIAVEETERGLEIVGRLALSTEYGRRAHELLLTAPGALSLSVGFVPGDYLDQPGPLTHSRVDWAELSLVSVPSQAGAVVTSVKTADRFPDRRTFEHEARHALRLSARQAKALAAGGWSALVRHEPEQDDPNAQAINAALSRIANTRI